MRLGKNGQKVAFVDIDETICFREVEEYGYPDCVPNKSNIAKINKLYDDGWYIMYWTARGAISGINHYDLTHKQLKEWGCKFHDLSTGTDGVHIKPSYDLVVDDKSKRIEELPSAHE